MGPLVRTWRPSRSSSADGRTPRVRPLLQGREYDTIDLDDRAIDIAQSIAARVKSARLQSAVPISAWREKDLSLSGGAHIASFLEASVLGDAPHNSGIVNLIAIAICDIERLKENGLVIRYCGAMCVSKMAIFLQEAKIL